MAFIRAKKRQTKSGERVYYYVVESFRDDEGKPRQRTLAYLGTSPTVSKAIDSAQRALEWYRKASAKWQGHADDLEAEFARCCPTWTEDTWRWIAKDRGNDWQRDATRWLHYSEMAGQFELKQGDLIARIAELEQIQQAMT